MGNNTLKENRNEFYKVVIAVILLVVVCAVIIREIKVLNEGPVPYETSKPSSEIVIKGNETAVPTATPEVTAEPTEAPYVFVNETANTIETRFNPPKGYTRVDVDQGSFGEYLRTYELLPYGTKAKLFSGAESDDASTLGVFKQQDEISKNQQCADTAIMLYAEYLYSQERYSEIMFEFSSGFECDYISWAKGFRVSVSGNDVKWVNKVGKNGVTADDYSYETFVEYLKKIYEYANTDSLKNQFKKKNISELEPGDVFIASTKDLKAQALLISQEAADEISYGHLVIVADVAVNENGDKVFLLVEGTTPATECSVVGTPDGVNCCWFSLDENNSFVKGTSGIKWQATWLYSFE